MRIPLLLVSCSLLLAACGSSPATTPQASSLPITALAKNDAALTVKLAPDVQLVTVELSGKKLSTPKVFSAVPKDGVATVVLSGADTAKYSAVIRGYDRPDRLVVLYRADTELSTAGGKTTTAPALTRVTATVQVSASPVHDQSQALVAQLGDLKQPLTVSGSTASGAFARVPTARGLTVTVEGRSSDGQQTQTGQLTFNLSEGGSTAVVPLTDVTSCPPSGTPVTTIPAIQGDGATSPLTGQPVTVRGVVTGDLQSGLRGFYLQDPKGDNNPATSDGVFVYTGTTPQNVAPGDLVQFNAVVREFKGSSDKLPGTETELDTVTSFVKCGAGVEVKPTNVTLPINDFERYEGMLLQASEPLFVTETFSLGRYGELTLSSGGRQFNPTNFDPPLATQDQLDRLRLVLDDGQSAQNPAPIPFLSGSGTDATRRIGDQVSGLTGVLRYANDAYKLEATVAPSFLSSNPRPAAPQPVGPDGVLRVAGANVLNYFTTLGSAGRGATTQAEFDRQKAKVAAALKGLNADIITLMEVENNGETTLTDLVNTLNAAIDPTLQVQTYRPVLTGTVGTDQIRVAILYKPSRVNPVGAPVIDTNSVYSRPPVAQTFQDRVSGGVLTVVANHFKSKGSCPADGDVNADQGQGCWNPLRVQQAQAVLGFASRLSSSAADPDVLLLGDLNSYGAEDPIKTLQSGGFESLNLRIPQAERYSYVFGGLSGYLDHALASSSLSGQVSGITEWHINSDEPTVFDYNTEFKTDDRYAPTPFRASDHDPVLVGLSLTRDADRTLPALTVTASGASTTTVGRPYTLNVSSNRAERITAQWGDGTSDTLNGTSGTLSHTYAAPATVQVSVTATAGSDTASATPITVNVTPVPTGVGKLVVSQVYGGGGNSGATYRNDFIELFNAGDAPVDLSGSSVQYASSTGNSWQVTTLPATTLAPGQYFLVQEAAGTGGTTALPTPDATGTIGMGASGGKVLVARQTTAVGSLTDPTVLDAVTYSGLTASTSASRKGNGCTDTDADGDFAAGSVNPRTTATPPNVCPR